MKRLLTLLTILVGSLWSITPSARLLARHFVPASGTHNSRVANLALREGTRMIRAQGRGDPWISLHDGFELPAQYIERGVDLPSLAGAAKPTALAAADLDEDGVPDLVSGYSTSTGGLVVVHLGNVDSIYPNAPEAKQRKRTNEFVDSPFLPAAHIFELPEAPDFLGTGDFDADGHLDVVAAARGTKSLYLLPGDGFGGVGPARRIELPGTVTAMTVGEINRADGLADVVVGIVGEDGAKALVFESPRGALRADPEIINLPSEATGFALGQLDQSYEMDLAIAAGRDLLLVHGRDRKLATGLDLQHDSSLPAIDRRSIPFSMSAIATGDFIWDTEHLTDIALLTEDGEVYLLEPSSAALQPMEPGAKERRGKRVSQGLNGWKMRRWTQAAVVQALPNVSAQAQLRVHSSLLVCSRSSSLPADDLLVLDQTRQKLHLLTGDVRKWKEIEPRAQVPDESYHRLPVSMDVEGEPVAVLPMRLNSDALSDLVILTRNSLAPSVVLTASAATFTVTNTNDSGTGSLRQAILDANASPGADTVSFSVETGGLQTIIPTSQLPTITDPVTVDATTQPNAGMVELNGSNAGLSSFGFDITAGNTTIRGLAINRFSILGLLLRTNGNDKVEGNLIGTNAGGSGGIGNAFSGVVVESASNCTVGGTTAAARNVLSGNVQNGVEISGTAATGNRVQGNFIGTNSAGSTALANGENGTFINNARNNTIGGTEPGEGNVISANTQRGVRISGTTGTGNLVQGNFIGTNASGNARVGNGNFEGVTITAASNTIGGSVSGARNTISGNAFSGVHLNNASSNTVLGNFIGTDTTGALQIGNGDRGVFVDGLSNDNAIGGTGAGNRIAFNTGAGVHIFSSIGNRISRNNIFFNGGLGIDLGPAGVTPNDPGDLDTGANNLQNFPVLTLVSNSGGSTTISGTLNSTPNTTFTIEFFSNSALDPSGNGEGETFVGSSTTLTDSLGEATFSVVLHVAIAVGRFITSTTTDPANNTSEFCAGIPVTGPVGMTPTINCPGNITVDSDRGKCSALVEFTVTATGDPVPAISCAPSSGSAFQVGTTTVNCTATNTAGSASCTFTVTVRDVTPPTIDPGSTSFTAKADFLSCDWVADDFLGPGVLADNCTPFARIRRTQSPAPGTLLGLGPHAFLLTATDEAGNMSALFVTVTVVDQTPPFIDAPVPANRTVDAGPNCATIPDLTAEVRASDRCSPPVIITQSPPPGTPALVGANPVTVTVADQAANVDTLTVIVTVRDVTPPTITGPAVITLPASNNCLARLEDLSSRFTITDNCNPRSALSISQSLVPGTLLPIGERILTIRAEDPSQNASELSFTVKVVDLTRPRILQCPADRTLQAGPDCQAAVPDLTAEVLAIDDCPGALTISQVPAPGAFVVVGFRAVTVIVKDAAGNESTCTVLITVEDKTPPVIIACPVKRTLVVSDFCQVFMPDLRDELSALDNCTPSSELLKVQNPAPGALVPLGRNIPVVLTVKDSSLNTSTCVTTIDVVDLTPPVLFCPGNITVTAPTGQCSAVVNYPLPIPTDNCDILAGSFSCLPPSGSSFPVGVTTVTCTVRDTSRNAAFCSFTITVLAPVTIQSFSPTCALSGTMVAIRGSGFSGVTAVAFNGTAATFQVDSDTQITATVPAGVTDGPISVTKCGATITSTVNFKATGGPAITSFSPTAGKTGKTVTIIGADLANTTSVTFGGVAATIASKSDARLKVTVPSGAISGKIVVAAGDCSTTSSTDFLAPPMILSFSPASGSVGTAVTIAGLNFTGASVVKFKKAVATFQVIDNSTIIATVPAGAKTGLVSIITPAGTAKSSASFTVMP